MTNLQLYLAIGVPLLVSVSLNTAVVLFVYNALQRQIEALDRHFDTRFNDMKDMWRAELHRVEEVLDARLKHLEERSA